MLPMSQPFKTKEFKKLKDKWYKKLEKSGFIDVEQDENTLIDWDSFRFGTARNKSHYEHHQEYFSYSGEFLHTNEFESHKEHQIWSLHAEGKSIKEIADTLTARGFKSCKSKQSIFVIVKRLKEEMFKKFKVQK